MPKTGRKVSGNPTGLRRSKDGLDKALDECGAAGGLGSTGKGSVTKAIAEFSHQLRIGRVIRRRQEQQGRAREYAEETPGRARVHRKQVEKGTDAFAVVFEVAAFHGRYACEPDGAPLKMERHGAESPACLPKLWGAKHEKCVHRVVGQQRALFGELGHASMPETGVGRDLKGQK